MIRGRKPKSQGDPPVPPDALPRCPPHLDAVARKAWRRLATPLYRMGVLMVADRAAFAAYCQAYSRWAQAEKKLAETPMLIKAPSGYPQQSPWLSIANRQMELMCRYMTEMGLTPSSRLRVAVANREEQTPAIQFKTVFEWVGEHGWRITDRPRDVVDVTADDAEEAGNG